MFLNVILSYVNLIISLCIIKCIKSQMQVLAKLKRIYILYVFDVTKIYIWLFIHLFWMVNYILNMYFTKKLWNNTIIDGGWTFVIPLNNILSWIKNFNIFIS